MRDLFHEIISTLRQNKMRTALTGFSVAWGIFLLIALLGAGNGVLNALTGNMGTMDRSMTVRGGRTSIAYGGYDVDRRIILDERDLRTFSQDDFASNVEEISPLVMQSEQVSYKENYFSARINGIKKAYLNIGHVQVMYGRAITDIDESELRKVIMISDADAELLAGRGGKPQDMLGKDVTIGKFVWKVVGIFKTDESEGGDNSQIYAPYSTVSVIYKKGTEIPYIFLSFNGLDTEEENDAFADAYRRTVNANHFADPQDNRTVNLTNNYIRGQQMGKVLKIIRTALWILGLFSLLSGIVGVSNIMLITVRERTHEFGIRKAIGAKPMSILTLIITESIVITSIFGYVGMVLGMLANQLMDKAWGEKPMDMGLAQITMFVNPSVGLDVAIEATLVLIVAGTIAGLIPAWKASKVKPIEALRSE